MVGGVEPGTGGFGAGAPNPSGGRRSIWEEGPEEAAFRAELRAWLADAAPGELPADADERAAVLHDWHRSLAAAGYVGLSIPVADGGRGLPPVYEALCNEELGLAGAPPAPPIGHLAHALAAFGSDGQRARYLPAMLAGTEQWCQGFSEPDAGSDLASLRTAAVPAVADDGTVEGYRITGQKIWTSLAAWADRCLLLARTDPTVAPHRGLSMLVVPMDAPGVTCRPIVTAGGTREFAEVFFDDVDVPADAVVGEPGQGWAIANQLLAYERGPADIGWVARLRRLLTVTSVPAGFDPAARAVARDRLARAHAELRILELHVRRSLARRSDGSLPGPEGSIDKLLLTRVDQLVHEVVLELRGAAGALTAGADLDAYLMARAQSVFGGTSQIQRTVLGERVLGLPREARPGPATSAPDPAAMSSVDAWGHATRPPAGRATAPAATTPTTIGAVPGGGAG